tara:strand:+ start:59 stop:319 length:261 start_codon:yes stop_codon:yes gene_type:complete
MKKIALVIMFLFLPLQSFGKRKIIKGKDKIVYKKNTTINFSESVVDGELIKPRGGFHQSKARAKFNSLIIYRKDFVDKMIKNAKKL